MRRHDTSHFHLPVFARSRSFLFMLLASAVFRIGVHNHLLKLFTTRFVRWLASYRPQNLSKVGFLEIRKVG